MNNIIELAKLLEQAATALRGVAVEMKKIPSTKGTLNDLPGYNQSIDQENTMPQGTKPKKSSYQAPAPKRKKQKKGKERKKQSPAKDSKGGITILPLTGRGAILYPLPTYSKGTA